MDFVATIPFWALCIVTIYYFFNRKPDTLRYSSAHYMPEKRKQYLSKLKKYVVVVSISTGLLICVPFCSFLLFEIFHMPYSFYENLLLYPQQHPYIICFTTAGFLGWCIGLYFYHNRNIQHLQKLLEAMSDADYERFTEMPLTDIVHLEWKCREEYYDRSENKYELVEEAHIYTREQPNTPITITMPRDQYRFLERAYREAFHKD